MNCPVHRRCPGPRLARPGRANLELRTTPTGEVVAVDEIGQVFGVDDSYLFGVDNSYAADGGYAVGAFGDDDEFGSAEDFELGADTDDLLGTDDDEILGASATGSPFKSIQHMQRNMASHYSKAAKRVKGWKKHLKKAQQLQGKINKALAKAQTSMRQVSAAANDARAQQFIARHHAFHKGEWELLDRQNKAGLGFSVGQAPAGSGRLIRVPMYGAGNSIPGLSAVPAANFAAVGWTSLTSRSLPYARLIVLGFQTTLPQAAKNIGTTALVRNLQTAGGASLFLVGSADALNAEAFDVNEQGLAGLRNYPIISETNTVSVDVALLNVAGVGVTTHFDTWLVCDVIDDDLIGRGDRGPYAR